MEVSIETKPDHVHAVVAGEFSYEAAHQAVIRIAAACKAAGLSRVLIDGRGITTRVAVMHRYELAKVLADHARTELKMAVVVSHDNMFSKTLEHTAQNLGVDVHTTESMAEGLIFLGLME
jgi:hypothetical protein